MKSIQKLKEEARGHEQREDWERALQTYLRVLSMADESGADEILALYNRVGDLYLRAGRLEEAADYYEQAADRYREAGFGNNAIALCNKALRYLPDRTDVYRKLGRLSAEQGFISDARRWYIEYAERKQKAGEVTDAVAALEELAALADGPEIRELLGRQMLAHDRASEGVDHLVRAYAMRRRAGETDAAELLRQEILEADPDADPDAALQATVPPDGGTGTDEGRAVVAEGGGDDPDATNPEADAGAPAADPGLGLETTAAAAGLASGGDDEGSVETERLAGLDEAFAGEGDGHAPGPPPAVEQESTAGAAGLGEETEAGTSGGVAAPISWPDLDEAAAHELPEDAAPLPLLDEGGGGSPELGDEGEAQTAGKGAAEAEPEPAAATAASDGPARQVAMVADGATLDGAAVLLRARSLLDSGLQVEAEDELARAHPALAAKGRTEDAHLLVTELSALRPRDPTVFRQRVEYAARLNDRERLVEDCLALARCLDRVGGASRARVVYEQVLELDPENAAALAAVSGAAPSATGAARGRSDVGADGGTRFVVPAASPTGDERKDFAEMLAQFRAKVTEHVGEDDPASHFDLGLAFREMGLIDEAITEFQTALRGGEQRLKVFEELGYCYMEKQEYQVAERILLRALQLPHSRDGELVGVYYQLGRCQEALGRAAEARDTYGRVVRLDTGFRDAAERMARL